jgi:Ni,Fe-hydrogenase I large subunit
MDNQSSRRWLAAPASSSRRLVGATQQRLALRGAGRSRILLSEEDAPVVRQHAATPGTGVGLAETARGLLLHQAQVAADGRVERYRVVAPTEWNFHPNGALTRGLVDRPVKDSAAACRDATLLAQALDPCVAFAVEATDA